MLEAARDSAEIVGRRHEPHGSPSSGDDQVRQPCQEVEVGACYLRCAAAACPSATILLVQPHLRPRVVKNLSSSGQRRLAMPAMHHGSRSETDSVAGQLGAPAEFHVLSPRITAFPASDCRPHLTLHGEVPADAIGKEAVSACELRGRTAAGVADGSLVEE